VNLLILGRGKTGAVVADVARSRRHHVQVISCAENSGGCALTVDALAGIDAVLDSGETTYGLESTVVDASQSSGDEQCVIYRPGVITLEQIRAVCPRAIAYQQEEQAADAEPESLPSPGVALRHYAPRARLILIDNEGEGGEGDAQKKAFAKAVLAEEISRSRLGLMLPDAFENPALGHNALVYRWGRWDNYEELAQRLFAGLRWLDAVDVTVIVCPMPAAQGIGVAIRDRLKKAARTG